MLPHQDVFSIMTNPLCSMKYRSIDYDNKRQDQRNLVKTNDGNVANIGLPSHSLFTSQR